MSILHVVSISEDLVVLRDESAVVCAVVELLRRPGYRAGKRQLNVRHLDDLRYLVDDLRRPDVRATV